jgi:TRAP transporter TAXI family solute receptor
MHTLSVATKGPGSGSYTLMAAIGPTLRRHANIKLSVEPATIKTFIRLVKKGQMELCHPNPGDAYEMYTGTGAFEKEGPQPVRLLFSDYVVNQCYYTSPGTGIKSLADMRGKRVMNAFPGNPAITGMYNETLRYYGLEPNKDYTQLGQAGLMMAAHSLIEGRIDAFITPITAALHEVKRSVGLVILPVPQEVIAFAKKRYPFLSHCTIEEKWFDPFDIPEGTRTLCYRPCTIGAEKIPEDVVYRFLKAVFENYDEFKNSSPQAAQCTLENATKDPPIPFHQGSVRYFKERGAWTPELEALQKEFLAKQK